MKVIEPINNRWGYYFIALENESLTIIKLSYKSILKDAINSQVPFLYTNHFKNLVDLGGNKLKMKYSSETYNKKEIKSIKVLKGKTWNHKIVIHLASKTLTFGIINKEDLEEYQEVINAW